MTGKQLVASLAITLVAGPAAAASLLTSAAGYTGPILDTGGIGEPFWLFTTGPVALPGGITFTAGRDDALIGNGVYGFSDNGIAFGTPLIGTNARDNWIDLVFATPVPMFGGGFNYAVLGDQPNGAAPVLSAYDADDNLIAAYDLSLLAPISTPSASNAFAFRGIDGEGQLIRRFRLRGAYIAMTGTATVGPPPIPEPGTWAMLITGFGLIGAALRRRRAVEA